MRTLISTAFVSLDGVVEAPGGEAGYRNAGWTFKDVEFDVAAYELKGREQNEAEYRLRERNRLDMTGLIPRLAENALVIAER